MKFIKSLEDKIVTKVDNSVVAGVVKEVVVDDAGNSVLRIADPNKTYTVNMTVYNVLNTLIDYTTVTGVVVTSLNDLIGKEVSFVDYSQVALLPAGEYDATFVDVLTYSFNDDLDIALFRVDINGHTVASSFRINSEESYKRFTKTSYRVTKCFGLKEASINDLNKHKGETIKVRLVPTKEGSKYCYVNFEPKLNADVNVADF